MKQFAASDLHRKKPYADPPTLLDRQGAGNEGRERGHPALAEGGDALVPSGSPRSNRLPMQGQGANSTWHPDISIAGNRKRQI